MKFASKGDPLALALGISEDKPDPVVERPVIPVKRKHKHCTHYDYAAVKDELQAYIAKENGVKGRSLESIATDFGISKVSFRSNIQKLGISYELKQKPRDHITQRTDEKCIQIYNRWLEVRKYSPLGREFGISDTTAKDWIHIGEQLCRNI